MNVALPFFRPVSDMYVREDETGSSTEEVVPKKWTLA